MMYCKTAGGSIVSGACLLLCPVSLYFNLHPVRAGGGEGDRHLSTVIEMYFNSGLLQLGSIVLATVSIFLQ